MKTTSALVKFCALAVLAGALVAPLSAFTLEPMSLSLEPSGSRSIGSFRLSNESEERVAVAITMKTRSADENGREINGEAGDSFVVFPSRVVLGPRESKVFKIQWRGEGNPATERCFRLIAEQVPVEFGAAPTTGIRFMFRYIASIYVTPAEATARLELLSAVGALGPEGQPGFSVEIRNTGRRHVIALDSSLELGAAGEPARSLSGEAIAPVEGVNFLPGLSRRFFIPAPEAIPGKVYEGRFAFSPEY